MKTIFLALILLNLNGCTTEMKSEPQTPTVNTKHSFQEIWNEIISDQLQTLPQNNVTFSKLFTFSKNIILADAKRTLVERKDIIEAFDKLAHPNGVCLKGTWEITQANPYSGYFKNNSTALIIARASTALSKTKQGSIRPFGLAGKLFPTISPNIVSQEPTANFFVIDDLGGTDAQHYTDVKMTNEPSVSKTSEVFKNLLYAIKVASAFSTADKNSGIRQLYEISELGEANKKNIITPKWIQISAQQGQTVHTKDFRNEFLLSNKKIIFDIVVASKEIEGIKNWKKIGTITFDDAIISNTCDHRLHFHHPVWKDNLRHE